MMRPWLTAPKAANKPPFLPSRVFCSALLTGLLASLLGCGPGVGGTGVGSEPPPQAFGAQALSLCDSDLAPALACVGHNASTAPAPAPGQGSSNPPADAASRGTAPVLFANATERAALQGDGIRFTAPCAGLTFTGEWGMVPGATSRFFGHLDWSAAANAQGQKTQQLAQLLAQTSADGQTLNLQLLDTSGASLWPPTRLMRQSGAPPAEPIC